MNHSNCSVLLLATNLSNDPHCVRPLGAGCSFCDQDAGFFQESQSMKLHWMNKREESQQKLKVALPK